MMLAEIAFFTDQVEQMAEFYRRLLGAEPVASSDKMTIFFLNDTRILIHYRYLARDGELPHKDQHAFRVENVDTACRRMLEQGLAVDLPPQEFYWGRSAYLRGQDGRQIEITQKEK